MSAFAARVASNSAFFRSLAVVPVGIFVGGTSGIGQGMAEAFATHTQGNAHIVIIGRNKAAAEAIIAKFPQPSSPEAKHEFVQCDVTLMENVQKTTSDLLSRLPKINFLVLSPGYTTMKNRDESSEGIDRKMAVHYYARWKFISDLLPALKKAQSEGEDAKVYSVLSAGYGGNIRVDDLGLKKSFSKAHLSVAAVTYNDLMMEVHVIALLDCVFTHIPSSSFRNSLRETLEYRSSMPSPEPWTQATRRIQSRLSSDVPPESPSRSYASSCIL
ncbi:hypothetical protein V5O48_013261 [Marasmius crinis-equi]|uniref:Uncharacterized protein n=1 Tax=Marasmius crinis-equi TaxID=585013 RepID=A0ABR3F0I5_9AGAR